MHTWLIDNIKAVAVWLAQIAYGYMCDLSWRVKNISGHIWQLNFRPKSPIGDQQIKKKKKKETWENHQSLVELSNKRPFFLSFSCSFSPFRYSQIRMNLKWALIKSNWFQWHNLYLNDVQHLSLIINLFVLSLKRFKMLFKMRKVFNANSSAHFKLLEMFQS